MFSRFDNMVQHTQTHTKGSRRESSAGIASKIAIESRRKSESTPPTGRTTGKASKAKRLSSGSEPKGRKNRVHSMPMLDFGSTKENPSSLTAPLSPITGSSKSSSPGLSVPKKDSDRVKKKNQTSVGRRASIASSTSSSSGVSWYASKLHHSFDESLPYRLNLDLPPLGRNFMDEYSSYNNRSRHPLSPERSSHSEEDDDYEEHYQGNYQWGGMVDSMDVTLPPLRSSNTTMPTRLPSISRTGYSHNMSYIGPDMPPIVRRLSLAELEMPIDESIKSLGQGEPEQKVVLPKHDGVGVSEDELHALEAFGQLWSQGRDYVSAPDDTLVKIKMEDLSAPGLDRGRRSPRSDVKVYRDVIKSTMDLDP